jgi:hypothetical protein
MRDFMEVRHLVNYSRWKTCKNGNMNLKNVPLIISAFRNNIAKLNLHSLHHSGKINNNVLKLWLLFDLQVIHCRSVATLETNTR